MIHPPVIQLPTTPTAATPPLAIQGRAGRGRRTLVRTTCVLLTGVLAAGVMPSVATASPAVPAAPLASQTVVGLREGARGAEVESVQKALVAAGVQVPGGVDGVFGAATKSAVVAFQSRHGIAATGEVDAATAQALGLATAAPAAAANLAATGLTVGAQGDHVKELQNKLMAFGVYVPGGADGIFGQATKTAVSHFQRWNGLAVSGVVDAATAAKLRLTGSSAGSGGSAPSGVASTSYVGLKNGSRGDKVKELQQALARAGITVRGGADGIFGQYTAAALTSYQQAQGLAATGVVDDQVVSRLGLGSGGAAPAPAAPAAPAPSAGYAGLKVGSTGPLVKDLQRALMNTGLTLLGGADGSFGNATRSTLILFQRVNGFPQTGEVSARDASTLGLGGGTPTAPQGVSGGGGFAVYGERGDRVKSLQQSLVRAGISFAGGADGIFGAATAGAILAFQRREGLPATGKVDQATANRLALGAAGAPAPPTAAGVNIDVFPVQGQCWFGDTWRAPRGGGRTHEGVDIIAAKGNRLYAAVSGTISKMYHDYPGALSGNGFRIAQDNGTYFTYLHLDSFAPGIDVGAKVTAGQVVGYVGSTGNSATPHLHFEVHPNGGAGVNPYPLLKQIDACGVTAPRG